jgi:phenylalanyl-tRNA synthetase beta subunit
LVENLLFNERRQKDSVKLFEISDIYSSENGIHKKRMLSIIASGRVGLNYQDFSKKIDKKYLTAMFQEILPNEVFDFQILSRDSLDTKIKSEIIALEVDIERFSTDVLSYKEGSQSPESFAQFNPISDLPSSTKDLSYLIKDFSKIRELENLFLSYQSDIVKNIFIFDYFHNEKAQEVKIGFRIVFQSKEMTLIAAQIELVYNDLIDQSLKIDGISIPGI